MGLFTDFPTTPITLTLAKQTAAGNEQGDSYDSVGVFHISKGITNTFNIETPTADAVLHIPATDDFVTACDGVLVGHLARVGRDNSRLYRIIGQSEGYDFDTETLEFYRLALKAESETPTWVSSSPLT